MTRLFTVFSSYRSLLAVRSGAKYVAALSKNTFNFLRPSSTSILLRRKSVFCKSFYVTSCKQSINANSSSSIRFFGGAKLFDVLLFWRSPSYFDVAFCRRSFYPGGVFFSIVLSPNDDFFKCRLGRKPTLDFICVSENLKSKIQSNQI